MPLTNLLGSVPDFAIFRLAPSKKIYDDILMKHAFFRKMGFGLGPDDEIPADPVAWAEKQVETCLLYTSPSPRDMRRSRMPSSA